MGSERIYRRRRVRKNMMKNSLRRLQGIGGIKNNGFTPHVTE
jgi:hypothetical protein